MENLENLLKYYTECIEIESLEKFSFPSFKLDKTFINLPIHSEWSIHNDTILTVTPPVDFRRAMAFGSSVNSLYYGWPIYAHPNITQHGNPYAWIEPVFLLKIDFEKENINYNLSLLKEWPKVNDKILKRYAQTFEERIQILNILGLSEAEFLPKNGLKKYWDNFLNLYPNIAMIEDINTENITSTNFDDIQTEGFYNRAIIIISRPPRYSYHLLRELRLLKETQNINKITSTSLGTLISTETRTSDNRFPLTQISPLNRSQRQATTKAFTNNFSVITGPPGTGKSQVVLNILVNAFEKNLSVLFTSKNNKAVDVVCERILDLINFPINLRLGARTTDRDYTMEFLDLLDTVLSGGDRDSILTEYQRNKVQFEKSRDEYLNLLCKLDEIVSSRNEIDKLDQIIEQYQNKIHKSILSKIQKITYKESNIIELAIAELSIVQSERWPFFYKLFGLFSKTYPYKKLHNLCIATNKLIGNIFKLPEEVTTNIKTYSNYLEKIPDIYEYIRIHTKITKLREKVDYTDINTLSESVENSEKAFINASIRYIQALGRYRVLNLTKEERKTLTNYYSVVRQLVGDYPGNKAYARLKEQQEKLFRKVSKILPVWSVTNLSAGGHFPLGNNIFDIVVIDEASQSDIASAIPLLFRAKNAVIIGDPQQLKHISSIGGPQDNRLMQKYNLLRNDYFRFSYSNQSLYTCSRGTVSKDDIILLNEHYRSHFSIIQFSNREWYDGNLDIRTNYDNLFYPPKGRKHIEWIDIKGNTIKPRGRSAFNKNEAIRVLEVLEEIFEIYKDQQPSVGIVTPFTAQKDYLNDKLIEQYNEDFIRKHFLLANTAHQFQGDERDIVIFSPVISRGVNNNSTTVGFLRTTSNLFNVSITRAKSILWVVGDKERCINAGIKFLKDFVEYIEHERYKNIDLPYKGFQSPWEKRLFEVLVSEGFEPKSQYPTGPYFIDIALFKNGTRLAIEVDGKFWHSTLTGGRLERDVVRDRNLRRMGWKVVRFWVHDLKYDMENCLKIIKEKVNKY